MTARNCLVLGCLLLAACSQDVTSTTASRISCTTTPDCSAVGGQCVANECHATNECTTDADCTVGQTCVPDANFEGLCAAAGQPPAPMPAWSCSYGKDCPAGQGCASDGTCHVDGECHNTWDTNGYLTGDCQGVGQICAASGDPYAGFCTDGRGGPDPYCRSTGTGECRVECATADECGIGDACISGYCHRQDECHVAADCSPNHDCDSPDGWDDYGYLFCMDSESPTCVPDGQGACRLACWTDDDCLHGGGCAADGLCHGSNECHVNADCDPGLECYADAEFGGLCGPPRPL